jgi:long-subunit fatty acid transport protein
MKLRSLSFALCLSVPSLSLFAGGIVTNTNNSATWTRNPSTAATLGVDAVYYNPAATTTLGKGLFLSLSNQSIFQKREVDNSYSGLNQSLFKGSVDAPFFPTLYAAYNLNKFSFSFGFNPIGGGGSAEFKKGLPSFEIPISDLVPSLGSQGVNDYRLNSYFKGSSVYYGYQFGVAYKVSDQVSIFAGVRYVNAKNKYEGYLKDVNVQMNGQWVSPRPILLGVSGALAGVASTLQPLVENLPSITLAQAEGYGILPSANRAALEQGLLGLGVPQAEISTMDLTHVQGKFMEQSVKASITSNLLRDQEVDVEQTGSGICPIIGANFSLLDHKLNIGLKYEFATQMEVKNKTKLDFVMDSVPAIGTKPATATTMFPNGAKTPSDMPALLSIGVSYKLLEKLSVSGSLYYFFDKSVEYGKTLPNEEGKQVFVGNDKVIDNNFFDLGFGAEYSLTKKLLVSTGYLYGKVDVNQKYQADINHTITCHTLCFGGKYAASPIFDFSLGLSWNLYETGKKHAAFSTLSPEIALETYQRNTFMVGVGVDIKLSK